MINDYANEFNVSKEVIETLPKNNVKNRAKCISEIDELLKKYLSDREEVLEEIKSRYKEYNSYEINPELEGLNQQIQEIYKALPLLNDASTAYEKSGLDQIFYNLDHFYRASLESANENIFACINMFEKVGVELSSEDFVYSIYTSYYINEIFSERMNGVNQAKLKALFDSLYWKCPDLIKQITINFKYLFYKYKKYFDTYYTNQKLSIVQANKKDANMIIDDYLSLKRKQKILLAEDCYLIYSKFINHILDFKNYTPVQVDKSYQLILKENVAITDVINENILKLDETIKEYKSYLGYKYIVEDVKNLYKDKDKYNKIAAPKKKEIEKLEGKLISTSKKLNKMISKNKSPEKIENSTIKVNIMISQVEGLYKEYEENLFLERIGALDETTSIYEALMIAVSNYHYMNKLIKGNDETMTDKDVIRIIDELSRYLYNNELDVIKNIYITDERDIAMVIFDKYNLIGFNITPESLEADNIDSLIEATTIIVNNIHFEKVNINIDNIKFVFNSLDIVGKKE